MTARRRATIRTVHDRPEVVAAALRPDNTDEMSTRVVRASGDVDGDAEVAPPSIVTTIERETAGGLRTTVDDYVTNLQVAQQMTTHFTHL